MMESISEKIINQRYYSLILNSLGEKIRINLISGDSIEGLLYSVDSKNNEYLLINNPRRFSRTGVPLFLKESILKIYFKEILTINYELNLENIKNNKNKDFFMIDSQISKNKYIPKKEEKLIKYEIKSEDENKYLNQKLEDENDDENWDQFELNKKMYNVVSTYDENLYTTKLDKNKISEEDKIYADKIYKEIMGANNKEKNVHVLEDRGLIKEKEEELDEEDKYSKVNKNKNNNKKDDI